MRLKRKNDWIYNRMVEEKRKHESWAGDEWMRIAARKIESDMKHNDLINDLETVRTIKW